MSEGNIFQFEPIGRRRIPGRGEGARSRQERRAGPSTGEYDRDRGGPVLGCAYGNYESWYLDQPQNG